MNSSVIKEFLVGLGFQIDEAGMSKFIAGLKTATGRAALLGAGATAMAGLISKGISDIAKEAEQLSILAENYNTTAAAMDDFADTAEIVGIGQEAALENFKNFNKNVGSAALGVGRAKLVFEKLGIAVKDSNGHMRSTSLVLEDVKAKLSSMDRGQAVAVMRRIGLDPAMLRLFNNQLGDTVSITKELSDIDTSVGFDFEQGQVEAKAYMNQQRSMMVQVRLLQMWFSKLWEKLATNLMPKAREGLKKVQDAFESFRKMLQTDGKKIVEAITPILASIMRVGGGVLQLIARLSSVAGLFISRVVGMFSSLNKATGGWAGYLAAALIAWKVFNMGFLLTPLGAILGLSVGILALYDDFMTWKEGGDSLIDWGSAFGEKMYWAASAVVGIGAAILATKAIMMGYAIALNVASAAMVIWQGVLKTLQTGMLLFNLIMMMNPIALVVVAIAALIAAGVALVANWSTVKKWFSDFFTWFSDKFGSMTKAASTIGGIFGGGSSAPSPAAQRSIAGNNANVSQATNIHINGAQNPHATAQAVAGAQSNVNANLARNMRSGAR